MFILEDQLHCEQEQFASFELALAKVRWLAEIPWDKRPNQAPCMSWATCGREYWILEYDDKTQPWTLIISTPIVEIDAKGVRWEAEFEPHE